jgi:hypothetical protein
MKGGRKDRREEKERGGKRRRGEERTHHGRPIGGHSFHC